MPEVPGPGSDPALVSASPVAPAKVLKDLPVEGLAGAAASLALEAEVAGDSQLLVRGAGALTDIYSRGAEVDEPPGEGRAGLAAFLRRVAGSEVSLREDYLRKLPGDADLVALREVAQPTREEKRVLKLAADILDADPSAFAQAESRSAARAVQPRQTNANYDLVPIGDFARCMDPEGLTLVMVETTHESGRSNFVGAFAQYLADTMSPYLRPAVATETHLLEQPMRIVREIALPLRDEVTSNAMTPAGLAIEFPAQLEEKELLLREVHGDIERLLAESAEVNLMGHTVVAEIRPLEGVDGGRVSIGEDIGKALQNRKYIMEDGPQVVRVYPALGVSVEITSWLLNGSSAIVSGQPGEQVA